MDLLLTDEQSMLRDSAATFAARRGGAERMRRLADSVSRIDRRLWRDAADAGWLAILAPEAAGGLGLGLTEICLVAQELGRHLIPEPVAAVAAVARALGDSDIAGAVIGGDRIVLPALMEGARATGDEPPSVAAEPDGDGYLLDGVKTGVPFPGEADGFLVSASADTGIVLAHATHADIISCDVVDGSSVGTLTFTGTPADAIAGSDRARPALAALLDALAVSNAAELLGVMEAAQAMTVEYLKIRTQFDRPIGSFQALQHRAVDNLAAIEMCRSLIYQAARAFDSAGGAPGLASAVLSKTAQSALDVCTAAVQMHGGIGFTHEHDIGVCLKRAMTLSARYGNAGLHRRRYAEYAELHD